MLHVPRAFVQGRLHCAVPPTLGTESVTAEGRLSKREEKTL